MKYLLAICIIIALFSCETTSTNDWTVTSPDDNLQLVIRLSEKGSPYYMIYYKGKTVVERSPLGLIRNDDNFHETLALIEESPVATIDETYQLKSGKRLNNRNFCREKILTFVNTNNKKIELIIRAYNDGTAFRYRFPEESSVEFTILEEKTGFNLKNAAMGWMLPYDESTKWTPAYENNFRRIAIGDSSPTNAGWAFPALFKTKENLWCLISEADLDGTYCACRLQGNIHEGLYRMRFPDKEEGNGVGQVEPASSLPWKTPWRVILIGDSPAMLVESNLITHVNRASKVDNTDWIKAGRASWSWWSESDSPRNPKVLKNFIDLAAEMSWEYSLIDANWNLMDEKIIRDLAAYAQKKKVGLLMWYNSGGPHNIVEEEPRDRLMERSRRREEFKYLSDLSVKGIKVDFFQSDKQNVIKHYLDIIEDAADFNLLLNFHGCTLPRGWRRTYPHVVAMEAVRGAECYKFSAPYPEEAPWHNVLLAFTRNVVGPMDYTPLAFTDHQYPHITSYGHELALSVVFESGILHFADRVEVFRNLPQPVKEFLKTVPVAWDDTKFLDGYPGDFIVLARKKGDGWYIAGLNGKPEEKQLKIDISFLQPSPYQMLLITDGENDRSFSHKKSTVKVGDSIDITMQKFGGFVIQLTPME